LPKGPFIYYVSIFSYQPQQFYEFFEHFVSFLCTKNFKLQNEISSKCNMEKEII
jgi:hypothetical protein